MENLSQLWSEGYVPMEGGSERAALLALKMERGGCMSGNVGGL